MSVTGTVSGGDAAISVRNVGQGLTTVNAVNTIATGNYGAAIDVIHGFELQSVGLGINQIAKNQATILQNATNPSAHNVSVTSTGTATGGVAGIRVANLDIGTTTVTAVDSTATGVSSETRLFGGYFGRPFQILELERSIGAGILVYGGQNSGDVSVTSTGTATGGEAGIYVRNRGLGTTTITAADSIGIGTSEYGRFDFTLNESVVFSREIGSGIYAYGGENSGDLSVTSTGTATGADSGIFVRNYGQGNTSVNAVDSAGIGERSSEGIDVRAFTYSTSGTPNSGDVTVSSTGTATGSYNGIRVRASTLGSVTVNAVDSTGGGEYSYGYGISVRNNLYSSGLASVSTGDLTITSTGTATGGETGIYALSLIHI